ncbi:RNA-binding domain-containing protein [Gymnopus androsaceus JB14]|uniref:RNA-binding domain-containing protein n=1 Tax=Gymnopus androsaceus JB14 TaxID=1447944 RepID=A0A6A4HWC2_9AGAR|nr:RNA-binding domain-containing protein [Gymnopus androsaceus JB14]
MDNAWDLKDQGNSAGISIPTDDFQGGPNNGAPSEAPRRSRSRSPGDRGRRGTEEAENPGNNLHVSGLSHKVDTRELEATFAKVGRVQKASVVTDPHTRESRLFGFVTMETREEADAAITALNGADLMGKVMTVTRENITDLAKDEATANVHTNPVPTTVDMTEVLTTMTAAEVEVEVGTMIVTETETVDPPDEMIGIGITVDVEIDMIDMIGMMIAKGTETGGINE